MPSSNGLLLRSRAWRLSFAQQQSPPSALETESTDLMMGRLDSGPQPELASTAAEILAVLKRHKPTTGDWPEDLHYLAPHIAKTHWTTLGDLVASREKGTVGEVPGERWISLRLDGSGFSNAVRTMRRVGVLEPTGFSKRFAEAMVACLRSLMEKFGAIVGYTQSDEMVVFIPPASVVRGEQQCHARRGRVIKICTLAAGYVTSKFVMELSRAVLAAGGDLEALSGVLPHFDCRMGSWSSWEEARALLMWRAYDCSVNGVSDAVHHSNIKGKKERQAAMSLGKREKIEWLHRHSMLPLPSHQAYGTVIAKVKRRIESCDPREPTVKKMALRSRLEPVEGPVLELFRQDAIFPVGDTLMPSEQEEDAKALGLFAIEKLQAETGMSKKAAKRALKAAAKRQEKELGE